jgi:hypothetical protein
MNTEIMIKAAIIESQAVSALQMTEEPTVTGYGRTALHHMVDAHIWSLSVLTAEPMPVIRARVRAAAADRKPLNKYAPLRVVS